MAYIFQSGFIRLEKKKEKKRMHPYHISPFHILIKGTRLGLEQS